MIGETWKIIVQRDGETWRGTLRRRVLWFWPSLFYERVGQDRSAIVDDVWCTFMWAFNSQHLKESSVAKEKR